MYKTRSKFIARNNFRVPFSADALKKQNKIRRKRKATNFKKKASKLKVGNIVKGLVVDIKDFGAVVDINGITGFLHISEISHKWLKHPSDEISLNDLLKLRVISNKLDKKGRVSIRLSRKSLLNDEKCINKKNNNTVVRNNAKSKKHNFSQHNILQPKKLDASRIENRELLENNDYYKNIDAYIIELGSLKAVYEYYCGDAFCNKYAREKAPNLLNISKTEVIDSLIKLETNANETQKQLVFELLQEKQLDIAAIAEKVGVEPQTVCAFKDHSKLLTRGMERDSKQLEEASKNRNKEILAIKDKNITTSLSNLKNCPEGKIAVKGKNPNKHIRKEHDKLRKKSTSNSAKLKVPILSKPHYSKKKVTWKLPNRTIIEGSCPGCGAKYGCYCK